MLSSKFFARRAEQLCAKLSVITFCDHIVQQFFFFRRAHNLSVFLKQSFATFGGFVPIVIQPLSESSSNSPRFSYVASDQNTPRSPTPGPTPPTQPTRFPAPPAIRDRHRPVRSPSFHRKTLRKSAACPRVEANRRGSSG